MSSFWEKNSHTNKMTIVQESHIDFVLETHTKGMFFNPHRPEGLEFIPPSDCGLRFILRPTDPEGDACGHREGLVCKVYVTYPATKEQSMFVDSYNNRVMLRIADKISLPYKPKDDVLISEDGSWKDGFRPQRYLCPSDISQLIKLVESDLMAQTDRFLKLLRWRQRIDAPEEVISHRALYWKVGGGGEYPSTPPDGGTSHQVTVQGMFGIHWDDEYSSELQKLWAEDDLLEPLGHVLIREAAVLASESPRSSILIMTAALETAVKMHISSIAPDTAWLMEKIPSPPIFKILRDYIPLLHSAHGNAIVYWDKVKPFINKTKDLIELRNTVAHTGKIPEDASPIQDNLELVSDLLYLLDVLDGHEWAKTLVSYKLRQALDWPRPKDGRVTCTIKMGS